ncbi:MAG: hypothetical protein AAF657_25425 [Acidobacteriota bacterium]
MQHRARILLATFFILLAASPASAETSAEARKWLDKLTANFDEGPLQVSYSARLSLASMGFTGTLNGRYAQADPTHSRMELDLELAGPPGMSAEPMKMKVLNVTDGTTVWTELENAALGGSQVSKVALEDAAKLAASAGAGITLDPAGMDPVAQMRSLTETMDFEVVERSEGTVTLRGTLTDQTNAMLAQLAGPGPVAFLFVLDESTGFPTELRAEGETPFVEVEFTGLERPKSLPSELFQYTPPEGVTVLDRGASLQ